MSAALAQNRCFAEVVVGGLRTVRASRAELARQMASDCVAARQGPQRARLVFASNGHAIALAAISSRFRALFESADIVHADGQPVVIAARLLARAPIPERSATTDFIHDAADMAAKHGLRIYLLGGSEEVSARCAERLRTAHPGLQICGRRNGYFARSEEAAICDDITSSRADIVFVGLGVPLEYEFSVRNTLRLRAGWIVTCGGAFNFVTGDYRRAPRWMQQNSLEWLYRLVRDPARLFWRYALTNPLAMLMLLARTG
jgi:exopolysaccharide biosynthesis WecB/TagA/CpsF family protein